jgi:hypothetical protein
MPLFGTFSSASSRALGLRNGSPPLPPTISAPSDNVSASLTGSGNTTNRINTTVSFTSTVTSFAIARFEFKVDQLDGSNNPVVAGTYQTAASAGATSFLLSNLLTSTRYGLYMRTVDVAGLVSVPTSVVRFITAAEVAPTVPARTLSSTALSVTIAYAAGTAGTYPIGTREFSLCPTTGGTTTYVPFTGTVTRTTRTDGGAALVPNTGYTVSFRYTASSPTTLPGSTASSTISTLEEVSPGAPGATLSITGTTTATVSRGTSTAGTYPISNYQFRVYQGTTPSGTWIAMPNTTAAVTGLAVDTGHRVQVKAVAATSGTETISTSVTATTNPSTPTAPTDLAFSGMTTSSTGTATLTFSKPTYASSGFVVVSSSTGGATGTGTFAATLSGSTFSVSIGSQSYNATYTYRAYVRTRLFADGVTTADSGLSNTKTWNTPQKNVPRTWTADSFGLTTNYTGYTYVIPRNSCEQFRLAVRFPSSVPNSPDTVGYMRVDYMTATFRCNVQLKRPSDNANFQVSGTTASLTSLCNTTNLNFSYATYVNSSTIEYLDSVRPNIGYPTFSQPNLGASDQNWYRIVSVGGASLNNKVFFADSSTGKSWNSGCSLSLKGDYFSGKNMSVVGVETIPGSFG